MAYGMEQYISPINVTFLLANTVYSILFFLFLYRFRKEWTNKVMLSLVAMSIFNALLILFKFKEPWMFISDDCRDYLPVSIKILNPELFPHDCFTNWLQFSHPLGYPLLTAALISLRISPLLIPKIYAAILSASVPILFFQGGHYLMRSIKESLIAAWISLYLFEVFTTIMVGLPRSFGFVIFSCSLILLPKTLQSSDLKYPITQGSFLGVSYLFHPPSFLTAAFLIVCLSCIYVPLRKNFESLKRLFICLAIAGVIILPQLILAYAHRVEVGPIASNEFIKNNPLAQEGGRLPTPFYPLPYFISFFHPKNLAKLYGVLPLFLITGIWALTKLDNRKEQYNVYSCAFMLMLIPTLTLLSFAALFLQPQRYMFFVLFPMTYISALGIERLIKVSWDLAASWKKTCISLILMSLILMIPVHLSYFQSQISGESAEQYYSLCLWIKSNTVVNDVFSTHPRIADWIRLLGERSVVISDEYGGFAPNYVKVTEDFLNRMNDTLFALYTESEDVLRQYTSKYNVSYYIVVREFYAEDFLSGDELYPYEPYNTYLKHYVTDNSSFAIFSVDFLETVYEDSYFILLKAII